ncbi:hypothetical protein [Microbacterium sp.]|uniref:hypothetical protein n=1 Tax=Microbacterium sp. TaxID=51671 RepID=UPI00289DE540|nr:hypothetical protein [Microbacterium sp.]
MSDNADLAARLADLEAENARLRAASVVAAEPPEAASPGGRWRAVVSAVCIVIDGVAGLDLPPAAVSALQLLWDRSTPG